ncbi:hypothetical protein [Flavobacterium sp. MK4S-17]|uniref:hypothetical protein n=1 Tax=Flavobacterium sp. MK4S-17 TaxID=2543737 RepID=UPI001356B539|nr:hypothetical protein [Flavobacterium sp. MK4S-17]
MKKYLFILFTLSLLFIACKDTAGKAGNEAEGEAGLPAENSYLEKAVGKNDNGSYLITNIDVIKPAWEEALRNENAEDNINSFRIVKGKTEGDSVSDYYMLLAESKSSKSKIASLLTLKGNTFYFEKIDSVENGLGRFIICTGGCADGCLPSVKIVSGKKYLYCSACSDCTKIEKEIR